MSRMAPAHCTKCGRIPPQPWSRTTAGNGPDPSGLNSVPATVVAPSALWKLTLVAQPDRVMMALMNGIRLFRHDLRYGPTFRVLLALLSASHARQLPFPRDAE